MRPEYELTRRCILQFLYTLIIPHTDTVFLIVLIIINYLF
jgi:hypothetical protein